MNDLIRRAREAEQKLEFIRAKLIKAEQRGFVTPYDPFEEIAERCNSSPAVDDTL